MFFLVEGNAEARLATGKNVRSYGPGSYFGELSFINPGHRRSTTIVATAPTKLHVLDQTSVKSLLATHPSAIFTLLRRACAFLVFARRAEPHVFLLRIAWSAYAGRWWRLPAQKRKFGGSSAATI